MKNLSLITMSLLLAVNLSARENPFELTNAYEEEAARIIEMNESTIEEQMTEAAYINEMQKKMDDKPKIEDAVKKIVPVIKEQPKEKVYTKKEVDKIINKTKQQAEYKTKQIVKKELEKQTVAQPTQVVYVKPRPDVIDDELVSKELLPFVKVEYNDDKLIIKADDEISKKFTLDKENKIIVDYKGKKNFYTKRDNLESKNFKRIAVGNHQKEEYYRVVVELNSKPTDYEVTYKDNLITISKTN